MTIWDAATLALYWWLLLMAIKGHTCWWQELHEARRHARQVRAQVNARLRERERKHAIKRSTRPGRPDPTRT